MHSAGVDVVTVSIDRVIRPAPLRRVLRASGPRIAAVVVAAALATTPLVVTGGTFAAAHPATSAAPATPGSTGEDEEATEAAETGSEAAPALGVTIDALTPSTAARRGRVTVSGQITNNSESTWSGLDVYLFTGDDPMTTSAELAEATATEVSAVVGERITTPGLFVRVRDLAPGDSTSYRLSVPMRVLPFDGPGVYWLGVHVLGQTDEGRVEGADGRARTFMTWMPQAQSRATLSLVVPLRASVRRTPEGRLANLGGYVKSLDDEGRLNRLLELADTADDVPLTWVVDPAVVEAVASVAAGDPGFDLAPTDDRATEPGESPGQSPGGEESVGPVDPDADEDATDDLGELSTEAQAAETWLTRFTELSATQTVLAAPYGDVDVATLLRGDFEETLDKAAQLAARTMIDLGIESTPVLAPYNGLLPPAALDRLDADSTLLLSESAVDTDAATLRLPQGTQTVVTSDVARLGGPAPTPPFDALALRQRILAEAAVRALTAGPGAPLVVSTPELWNPGASWRAASFFDGLEVPWLQTVDLPTVRALSDTEDYEGRLRYSPRARRREVPVPNVLATQELDAVGSVLAGLLTRNDTIDRQVSRAAMLGSSVHARPRPRAALLRTRWISESVHGRLEQVYVEGSPLVTMSSETGHFSVTVVNDLDEPVTVGIRADTGNDDLQISSRDRVALGPRQRASLRMSVRASGTGVHAVRIVPTTLDGRPLGRSTKITVRSSQVGLVIWLVMGTGAALFVVAIGARIWRRLRDRKRTHGPRLKETV